MKRILAIALTLAMLLSLGNVVAFAEDAEGMVLQDLSYDEVLHRVGQGDAGFTQSSAAIYAHHLTEDSAPRNDSGYQFYYISLSQYSGSFEQFEDAPLDQWFIDYLDESLANLRANGGGCMIRATYGLDGQTKCEPTDFSVLLGHVKQLADVFSKYPDVITAVECGMIGAFGEMWGGLYSDNDHKAQVLGAWLDYLPEEIYVNVRTAFEYLYYINVSEWFINDYKGQTVDGITYPAKLDELNYWKYSFEGTEMDRVGFYNDAMVQDGNDGGTFPYRDWDAVNSVIQREGFISIAGRNGLYGGEFSGYAGDVYRYKLSYWMPGNAIPVLAQSGLSYYHGGNAAYQNIYKKSHKITWYWSEAYAAERERTMRANVESAGLGMTYSFVKNTDHVKVKYPDGTVSEVMNYEAASALMNEYNSALAEGETKADLQCQYIVTTGGWDSAKVDASLFASIAERKTVTADLDDYMGQSASKYFEDHVGYRIVLRESKISGAVAPGGTLRVSGIVDNTGFADIVKNKTVELVLVSGGNTYVIPTGIDSREWKSGQRSAYSASVTLPYDMVEGNYSVFMRVANKDTDGNTVVNSGVAFANAGDYTYTTQGSVFAVGKETFDSCYNSEVGGNYIGAVSVAADYYDITFANYDGTPLQSVSVRSGDTPVYNGETPVRESADGYYYEFAGWDKVISPAAGNVTYTATYTSKYVAPGDANGDGIHNVIDLTLTAQYIAQNGAEGIFDLTECYVDRLDINGDGKVSQKDLNALSRAILEQ